MRYLALVALLAFLAVPFMSGCSKEPEKAKTAPAAKAPEGVGAAIDKAAEDAKAAAEKAAPAK
jgi:outer membrane murein-binding lipoprotein Lpp